MYHASTMSNEFHTGYQYDRCTSRGICSINPTTSALQEVILLYLRHASYYGLKLSQNGKRDKRIEKFILNTLSILSSSYEISEVNFGMIKFVFTKEFNSIINDFKAQFPDDKGLDTKKLLKIGDSLNENIKYGEKEFNKRIKSMPSDKRNLYRILFILIKSLSINILTYESYSKEAETEVCMVMKVLNLLNNDSNEKEELKKIILEVSKVDCKLMQKIREEQEKRYGKQRETKVSFSTTKGRAVLVVGSNLRELENVLEQLKDTDIDVYTHDNMILAHTFPKFSEYKNLKGQFGQGMENCLLDFSTFPGPIILTRNSLFNVESLYRGRLFTTDFAYSKGVIPIKNNDFSDVIKSAEDSKGFKTGKKIKPERLGYDLDSVKEKLNQKQDKGTIIIGLYGYTNEENEYFKTFFNHLSENFFTVSHSFCESDNKGICLHASGDTYSMINISEYILNSKNNSIPIFIPYTDRHTLSVIINLSSYKNAKIFAGKWNQTVLTPNIMESLNKDFGVFEITSPKNDIDKISNL